MTVFCCWVRPRCGELPDVCEDLQGVELSPFNGTILPVKDISADEISGVVGEAAAALRAAGAREVYLFGSAAKGQLGLTSDVDLAVSGLPPESFYRAMARAASILGRPLDLVDLDEDTPFTRYLRDEGELRRVG
jgi:predicted nucleotidyltransferase